MLKYIARYKFYFIVIGIIIVVEPILASSLNLYFEKILNYVVPGADLIFIARMMLIAFFYWITKRVINFIFSVINSRCMDNIRLDIKNDTFKNLLKMNTAELEGISGSGEFTSIFINDINIIEARYFNNIVTFVASVVSVIVNVAALTYMNYKLAIPILGFACLIIFIPFIFARRLAKSQFEFSVKVARFTHTIKEFIGAYPTIKNYEVEEPVFHRFRENNLITEDSKFLSEYDLALSNNISSLLSWFMQIIAVAVGFVLVIKGEILLGTVIVARSFANEIAEPLNSMVTSFSSIISIRKITSKIKEMTGGNEKEEPSKPIEKYSSIYYEDVSLTLNEKNIINHFSYKFDYGKKYLVIGRNGSGKSTLFRLLKKRYTAYEGNIKVGDTDIKDVSTKTLASSVSYLNEKVDLFTGTVADNIRLFSDKYSSEEVKKAAQQAQLSVDLERGVNDSGFNISSGEKRRLEIARSLLQGSDTIIFDEVVSTLDAVTAFELEGMILGYDKTVVFISHNFSAQLIKKYDQILVLDKGNLVDSGTYDELIERNSYFQEMCRIKFDIANKN